MEYRPGEESIDAEGEEDLQSLIQVRGDRALGVPSGVVRTHSQQDCTGQHSQGSADRKCIEVRQFWGLFLNYEPCLLLPCVESEET